MLELVIGEVDPGQLICRSSRVLGNGRIDDIRDVIVVDRQRFERASSRQVAAELAQCNAELSPAARTS